MNHQKKNKCLLLNSDYTPLCLVAWKKAIIWSIRHKEDNSYGIEILSYSENSVFDASQRAFPIPSVARSLHFFNVYKRDINFSRRNLFIRDDHTCQYCGKTMPFSQLTYDHVIPKSRYKPNVKKATNWNNVVTACIRCNNTKGNRTPEEAGMKLKNSPAKPRYAEKYLRWYLDIPTIASSETPTEWMDFIS
jgi:hypothetical protein